MTETQRALRISDDHWRSRWLVLPGWNRLHRISEIEWEDAEMVSGEGVTVCGLRGFMFMPGMVSRLYLERCAHCCRLVGIAPGAGAPFNKGITEREVKP